jgi:redox-sensing transcriptional repressor
MTQNGLPDAIASSSQLQHSSSNPSVTHFTRPPEGTPKLERANALALNIPDIVIGRLPIYLRTLKLLLEKGQQVTSSQELGELLGISSAQIRKDFSHFGEFGKQGTGYNVTYLCQQLEKILKVDCVWPVLLVGAGYLGHALASYNGFEDRGFRIIAVFDSDTSKIGQTMGSLMVLPMSELATLVKNHQCQIGIIAVPAQAAQEVANCMIEAGINSILCYAPITLTIPARVLVEYIDPVVHFQHMTFYLSKQCIDESDLNEASEQQSNIAQ